VEATEGSSPVYADLKKKFTDDEARHFADRVIARSRQARRHALALKQLAERFSIAICARCGPRSRALGGLAARARRNFEREIQGLRRELQQVFSAQSDSPAAGSAVGTDAELQETVRRLYEITVAFDEDVRQSSRSRPGQHVRASENATFLAITKERRNAGCKIQTAH